MRRLVIGCVWILACNLVAMLFIQRQIAPGDVLMLAGPGLVWVSIDQLGWPVGAIAIVPFLTLFRHHVIYSARCAVGQRPEVLQ